MDNLGSSLRNGLPRQRTKLQDLDESLVTEFKTAACSVTQLFKLCGARTSVAKDEGYLQAVMDLLTALNDSNGQLDVVEWALNKKRELSGEEDGENEAEEKEDQCGDGNHNNNNNLHKDTRSPIRNTSVRPFTFSSPFDTRNTTSTATTTTNPDEFTLDLDQHHHHPGSKRKLSFKHNHDKKRRNE